MRRALTLLALTASLGLSACGFTPLYAEPGVASSLAAIDVVAPNGRAGFLIRSYLDDAFAKGNRAGAATYTMELVLGEARYPRGVRIDNVATRYEYVLTASYILKEPTGGVAKRGSVRVPLTYDSADQPYASIAAQQDAQDRAAEEAARRITQELAAWLATRS